MSKEVELLEQFFAAINRNDIDAAASVFHPEIERIEPPGFPTAGTYRGVPEVTAHLRKGRGTWAEGSCDPEGFFQNGDTVVVYLHAHVRVHGAADWIDGRFADGFVVRDGKLLRYLSFETREEALAWAAISLTP
jgi:uncharacterized protein